MNEPVPDRSICRSFLDETRRTLDQVETRVRELVRTGRHHPDPGAALKDVFSLAHSVKGGASFLKFHSLARVAAAAEQFVAGLRSAPGQMEPADILLLHEICVFFRQGIDHVRSSGTDRQLAVAAEELAHRLVSEDKVAGHAEKTDEGLERFIDQVDELMRVVERELLLWDLTSVDPDRLLELIASLEALQGLFADGGYMDLERICGAMGNVLRRFHRGEVFQGEYPDKVFLGLVDVLYEGIDGIAGGGDGLLPKIEEHIDALRSIMRQPVGELLIQAGLVDPQTVEQALWIQEQARAKKKKPKRLGDLLVAMGEVSSEQVDQAIRAGRACPVVRPSQPREETGSGCDAMQGAAEDSEEAATESVALDRKELERLLEDIFLLEQHRAGLDGSLDQVVTGLLRQAREIARSIG